MIGLDGVEPAAPGVVISGKDEEQARFQASIARAREAARKLLEMEAERPFMRDEDLPADLRAEMEQTMRAMDASSGSHDSKGRTEPGARVVR